MVSQSRFVVGSVVEVHGLINKPDLNGARGIIKDLTAGRWIVEIGSGGSFSLKPSNIRGISQFVGGQSVSREKAGDLVRLPVATPLAAAATAAKERPVMQAHGGGLDPGIEESCSSCFSTDLQQRKAIGCKRKPDMLPEPSAPLTRSSAQNPRKVSCAGASSMPDWNGLSARNVPLANDLRSRLLRRKLGEQLPTPPSSAPTPSSPCASSAATMNFSSAAKTVSKRTSKVARGKRERVTLVSDVVTPQRKKRTPDPYQALTNKGVNRVVSLSLKAAVSDGKTRAPRLVDLSNGEVHTLPNNGIVSIGRDSECDIIVPSPVTSNRLCVLFCNEGNVEVESTGDQDIFLNDVQVPKGELLPQHVPLRREDILALVAEDGPRFAFLDGAKRPLSQTFAGAIGRSEFQ